MNVPYRGSRLCGEVDAFDPQDDLPQYEEARGSKVLSGRETR